MTDQLIVSALQPTLTPEAHQQVLQQITQQPCSDLSSNLASSSWWQDVTSQTSTEIRTLSLKLLQTVLATIMQGGEGHQLNPIVAQQIIHLLLQAIASAPTLSFQQMALEILALHIVKPLQPLQWRAEVFTKDLVQTIFRSLTEPALHIPGLNQKSRFAALMIYQEFTLQKTLLLDQTQHPSVFISGVLTGVYQEKDPRNLIISFDLLRYLLQTYMKEDKCSFDNELQEVQFAEDFYDSISCYFPINFTPPKNDPIRVSPATLKGMLADCLVASPKMVGHFVPFFIEKLAVKQIETKLESLELLKRTLEQFSTKYLNEDLLRQILSVVSNLFFKDVSDTQIQSKAGKLIGQVLDKMVPQNVNFNLGSKSELFQFVNRCVEDIEKSPDSMAAGMSSVLLHHISAASEQMQTVIATHVFLRLLSELSSDQLQLNRRVAYMSVLTGLLMKAGAQFCKLTTADASVVSQIKTIVFTNLEIQLSHEDQSMEQLWQKTDSLSLVLYEKTLFFVQALLEPTLKLKHPDLDQIKRPLYRQCAQVLLQTADEKDGVKHKMCFATLLREAETEPDAVSEALRVFTTSEEQIVSLYENGLLRCEKDVREGLQQIWKGDLKYLKPLAFCKASASVDQAILEVMMAPQVTSQLKYDHLKLLIIKIHQPVVDTVSKIVQACSQQQDQEMGLRALKFLVKHKCQISLETVSELLQNNQNSETLPKLVFFVILRSTQQMISQDSFLTGVINQLLGGESIKTRLVIQKALLAIGSQQGYTELIKLVKEPTQDLAINFQIICKELPSVITPQNGFFPNRLYTQRLYSQLKPILTGQKDTQLGIQLLIQICTLVTIKTLPADLTPLAAQAFTVDANLQVKRTCLQMFMRVVESDSATKDQKLEYLELYLPKILQVLQQEADQNMVFVVECMSVLERVAQENTFPSFVLMKNATEVLKCANRLKSDRKRVIRKFARGVINSWSQLK